MHPKAAAPVLASLIFSLGCSKASAPKGSAPSQPSGAGANTETLAAMTQPSLYDLSLTSIDGKPVNLGAYRDKVLLIVNVASECGFTPQYEGLQNLHEKYVARGLVVLGVPSNDFGRQEPGSNDEIQAFCSTKFGVTFPMFEKVVVKGEGAHPLYQWLTHKGDSVGWNFNKFLIDRKGALVQHYGARVKPESQELTQAIEALL